MADCFFDTSALVKRYLLEIGSAWVVEQCRPNSGNTVFISQATLVEKNCLPKIQECDSLLTPLHLR
jgi:hypothetical protein